MRRAVTTLIAVSVLLMAGCGGSSLSPGMVEVRLVDAPTNLVSSFFVTIDRIDVLVGADWQTIALPGKRVDLLALRDVPIPIANTGLIAGSYTKLRMKVRDASVIDSNGVQTVDIPAAIQNGFEIPCAFDIVEAKVTNLLMDFNAAQSLVNQNGGYLLQPVVPTVVQSDSGTITGTALSPFGLPLSDAKASARYTAGASYPLGFEINTSVTGTDGAFKIWALLPGEYTLNLVWKDPFTNTVYNATVPGVIVTAGQDSSIGDVTLN